MSTRKSKRDPGLPDRPHPKGMGRLVMYTDQSQTDGRLTVESCRLWDKRSREYAKEAPKGRWGVP